MIEQMHEIGDDGNYDLIISIGSMRSLVAHNFKKTHSLTIPLIFAGVTDPIELGILDSLTPANSITGIMREEVSLEKIGTLLRALKPSVKSILIPYYRNAENGFLSTRLKMLQRSYQKDGIAINLMPVDSVRTLPSSFSQRLRHVDTLWCLGGSFLEIFSEALVELCNTYNVTYFSNSAATAHTGAALSFGSNVSLIGQKIFAHAHAILEKNIKPSNLPITIIENDRKIIINQKACKHQGVNMDSSLLFLLKNSCIFEK